MKVLVYLLGLVTVGYAKVYDGAVVFEVTPKTKDQHRSLMAFEKDYDFWKTPKGLGDAAHIMVMKEDINTARAAFDEIADVGTHVADVDKLVKEGRASSKRCRKQNGLEMDWNCYHTYDEIMDWVDTLPTKYPGKNIFVGDVGTSHENRMMKAVSVKSGNPNLPQIFVDGGIHAREWISPATVTFIMNELLSIDSYNTTYLQQADFYFMPSINPDGYVYSWEHDRLWRKTRTPNSGGTSCVGTDPNRNWDFHWGGEGASNNPCSETYRGASSFSEPSQQVTRDQTNNAFSSSTGYKVYLSYHSYGNFILHPYGYSNTPSTWDDGITNYVELGAVAATAATAIENMHGEPYTTGNSAELLYAASGTTEDYNKGVNFVDLSYIIELRKGGGRRSGFILSQDEIIPCGEESFEGFKVFVDHAIANNNNRK